MDEVDKIIIQSLKQIGCNLENDDDADVFGLKHFTPDLLVRAVSKCLQEIKQDATLPKSLPENMAHRFTVATTMAEMCSSCGYRGDIGYQTFLYPNEVDIRRLFMFLIEQLPKEQTSSLDDVQQDNKDDFTLLMRDVRKKIAHQLKAPWVPQYCRGIGSRKSYNCNGIGIHFLPNLNLNIPEIDNTEQRKEDQPISTYQVPNIFQQISVGDFDLISSVLHKNAVDLYAISELSPENVRLSFTRTTQPIITSPIRTLNNANDTADQIKGKSEIQIRNPVEKLAEDIEDLKVQNNQIDQERQIAKAKINQLRQQKTNAEAEIDEMKKLHKVLERTSVILDNPEENISKLESLIEKTRERRLAVESQYQLHRNPALRRIEELKKIRQSKNQQSIHELRSTIQKLQKTLAEQTHNHALLENELKTSTSGVASRKEYAKRIYEFIGNISKQRNDIYKILDDTKDLQKQLNSVSAQLQRQFNYTDDLLFQSAKHDLHAKQAYKFLASLHAACNEICDLVSSTGQMTKESRDLEVQIDRERLRNVAASLEKITSDIQKFEMIIKTMKTEISQVENEIYSG